MDTKVSQLLDNLKVPNEELRRQAAKALGLIKSEASIEALKKALSDSSRSVSEEASEALKHFKSKKVAFSLLPLLESEDTVLRNYGAEILGAMGVSSFDALFEALKSSSKDVRQFAVESLSQISNKKVIPALKFALNDSVVNISSIALEALSKYKGVLGVDDLKDKLNSPDLWLKGAAIRALGQVKNAKSFDRLIKLDPDEDMVISFSMITALKEQENLKAIPVLLKMLKNSNYGLAEEIIEALRVILKANKDHAKIDVALDPLFHSVLKAKKLSVQISAIEILAELKHDYVIDFLISLYNNKNSEIRKSALEAVVNINPEDLTAIYQILTDDKQPMRSHASALHTLGMLKRSQSTKYIEPFLEHKDLTLVRVALDALFENNSANIESALSKLINSPITDIHSHTLEAIGRLKMDSFLKDVIKNITNEDEEISIAADEAFVNIVSTSSESTIHPFLNSFNHQERYLAYEYFSNYHITSINDNLKKAVHDNDERIRAIAIKAINNAMPENAENLIKGSFNDKSQLVVLACLKAYSNLKSDTSLKYLETFLKKSSSPEIIYEALIALAMRKDKKQFKTILSYIENENILIKLGCIEALSILGDARAIKKLEKLLPDATDNELISSIKDCISTLKSGK